MPTESPEGFSILDVNTMQFLDADGNFGVDRYWHMGCTKTFLNRFIFNVIRRNDVVTTFRSDFDKEPEAILYCRRKLLAIEYGFTHIRYYTRLPEDAQYVVRVGNSSTQTPIDWWEDALSGLGVRKMPFVAANRYIMIHPDDVHLASFADVTLIDVGALRAEMCELIE